MNSTAATPLPWHACFAGPASTPDFSIRAGATFRDSLHGPLICTFPKTTTRTAEEVSANVALVTKAVSSFAPLHSMLTRLTEKVARANALQHSGGVIDAEDWSELFALVNESRGVLEEASAPGAPGRRGPDRSPIVSG